MTSTAEAPLAGSSGATQRRPAWQSKGSVGSTGAGPRTRGRLAWSLAALWLLTWLVTVGLALSNRSAFHAFDDADPVSIVLPIGFAVIGTLVASRTPRNPIGWIFLVTALSVPWGIDWGLYAVRAYHVDHHGLPLSRLAVFLSTLPRIAPDHMVPAQHRARR